MGKLERELALSLVLWLPLTVVNEVWPLVRMESLRFFKLILRETSDTGPFILILHHIKIEKKKAVGFGWIALSSFSFLFLHCEMPQAIPLLLAYLSSVLLPADRNMRTKSIYYCEPYDSSFTYIWAEICLTINICSIFPEAKFKINNSFIIEQIGTLI